MSLPIRAAETPVPREPEGRLALLARLWRRFEGDEAALRRGGRISEVSATHYTVNGLSDGARLGGVVERRSRAGPRRGEIVRINRAQVVVAPFERSADAGIGDTVFRRG